MEIPQLETRDQVIADVQEQHEAELLDMANVVGVGVGRKVKAERETDEPCLSVFVAHKVPKDLLPKQDLVPPTFGKEIKTDVVETGDIFAGQQLHMNGGAPDVDVGPTMPEFGYQPEPEEEVGIEALRGRQRPAQPGYSVGHVRVTAGTIGAAVLEARSVPGVPRRYLLLSNNHVLANSNGARIGDPILQPGTADGGRYPRDLIGRLQRFVPIRFGGPPNLVDAAVAEVQFHDLDRAIYWIGVPRGTAGVSPRQIVQKTGRTTSYTTGRVMAVNAAVNVNYGGSRIARFVRQIVTSDMSAGGDSGSLVLDQQERAVGLLFAGSSRATILNPIQFVESLLGIRVGF